MLWCFYIIIEGYSNEESSYNWWWIGICRRFCKIIGNVCLGILMIVISILGGIEVYNKGLEVEAIISCWIMMPILAISTAMFNIFHDFEEGSKSC